MEEEKKETPAIEETEQETVETPETEIVEEPEPQISEAEQAAIERLEEEARDLEIEEVPTSKLIKSLKAQKEHWKKKALKFEEQLKAEPKIKTPSFSGEDRLDKIEFILNHQGENLTKDDVDMIASIARAKNLSLEETYKLDFIQAGLSSLKEKRRREEATPSPSSGSPILPKKDIGDLSDKEIKENFLELVERILRTSKK